MNVVETVIPDLKIIEPRVFGDERGFFLESYQSERYAEEVGIKDTFVQDNHSRSQENVLRGLHFQVNRPQGKLVRVVAGEVLDVAVDVRPQSVTFGQWVSVVLSANNKRQFWVPPGFAHGFVVLSDFADFEYKCTDYYFPEDEACLLWNDPAVGVDWRCESPLLSNKDQQGHTLQQLLEQGLLL